MPNRTSCQIHIPHKANMQDWASELAHLLFPGDPVKAAELGNLARADHENWEALERFLNQQAPNCFGGGCGVAGPHTPSVEPVANGENACAEGDGTVADGEDSVAAGKNNTIDGTQFWSGIFMGADNIIHDAPATYGRGNVIVGGDTNEITGSSDRNVILGGNTNVVTDSDDCVVTGSGNSLSGSTSFVSGSNNASTAMVDSALLGQNCATEADPSGALITGVGACAWNSGQIAHASSAHIVQPGGIFNRSVAQESFLTMFTSSTDVVAPTMEGLFFADIPYAVSFRGHVVAKDNDADVNSCWEFDGLYASDGAGGFRLIGSSTTLLYQDAGAATWTASIITETSTSTDDVLNVQVTGAVATNINWTASFHFTEVPGGI